MMGLREILDNAKRIMDEKDKRREEVYAVAREIRRASTGAIRGLHKYDLKSVAKDLKEAKRLVDSLEESDKAFSFTQESLQEYAEAAVTYALLGKTPIPSPRKLRIPPEPYILGLADSIGEIRRFILDSIRKGEDSEVEYYLDLMDEIYHGIMAFDVPNAVLPIRRKQDISRMLLEKTRGEVTLALRQAALEKKMG